MINFNFVTGSYVKIEGYKIPALAWPRQPPTTSCWILGPTKLHLGCGEKKIYGFTNVDIRQDVKPDLVLDITNVSSIYNNSVELIYACHVLEHFPKKPFAMSQKTYKDVLRDWHSALMPGGKLRLAVPDLGKVITSVAEGKIELEKVMSFFYGGEKHDYDFHYWGWNFETLKKDLEEIGFKDVQRYDWRKTEHHYVDDYSQCYYPHMDKQNGVLLSLNVEATK
jgi:predicted SAM-dependent methyltransferase